MSLTEMAFTKMTLTKTITGTATLALLIGLLGGQWLANNQLRINQLSQTCQAGSDNSKAWHLQVNNRHWVWWHCEV